jgi:C-terminal processing protease CtpA/Prc
LVRYNRVSPELRPYLFTWDSSFYDLTRRIKTYNQDYYLLSGKEMPVVKPRSNGFKGNTYLLVNAANSSATFYFAEIAKENKLATLIGETTGGSQKGLNGGMMFFLRLPNSGIEIDIPIVGSFSAEKPQGGIQPDIIVKQTVEELTKGEDKVIEETRNMIKKPTYTP